MNKYIKIVVSLFCIFSMAVIAAASEIDEDIAKSLSEMLTNVSSKPPEREASGNVLISDKGIPNELPPTKSILSKEERDIMEQHNAAREQGDHALFDKLNARLGEIQQEQIQYAESKDIGGIEFGPMQVSNPLQSGAQPLWIPTDDFAVKKDGAKNPSMAVRPSNGDLWVIVQDVSMPTNIVGYVTPDNGRTWWWMFTRWGVNYTEPSAVITNGGDGENLHVLYRREKTAIEHLNISLSNWADWRAHTVESSAFELRSPKLTSDNPDWYSSYFLYAAYTRYDTIANVYLNGSFERSTDLGGNWSKPAGDFYPATGGRVDIAYANRTLYIAYDNLYAAGDRDIWVVNSTNYGFSWGSQRFLAYTGDDEYDPSVTASLGSGAQSVVVAYTERPGGSDSDIEYAYSYNKGFTWNTYRNLPSSTADEHSVDLAVDPNLGKVHAAYWWNGRINYSSANYDSLFSFSQPETISQNSVSFSYTKPTIAVNPNKLPDGAAIAWTDLRQSPDYSVYFDAAYLQPYSTLVVNQTSPACTVGDEYYSTIQAAVNAALAGDTVVVCPGTYVENVDVSKDIDIMSYTQNPANTKVRAADPADYIFNVDSAGSVEISGFNITGASTPGSAGVYLFNSGSSDIRNNQFVNDYHGVYMQSSNSVIVYNNTIEGSYEGIQSHITDFNWIYRNNLSNNTIAITVSFSNYTYVEDNNIDKNSYGVMFNKVGYSYVYENLINISSWDGINIQNSQNNYIYSNIVTASTRYGIYIVDLLSNDNRIYNNYFDNTNNARDPGINNWNITKTWWFGQNIIGNPYWGGNYWRDYKGIDLDNDGLGDTLLPYNSNGLIINGGDRHPLTGSLCYDYTINQFITPPLSGNWNVDHRIECNDVKINLNGNLDINANGNLSINNVTLMMNVTEMGQYSINVNSGSKFFINSRNGSGSNITNGQNKSVYYTFKVRSGSTFQMRNSSLSDAGTGLLLPDFSNNGIWINANDTVLENNTIKSNHFDGIYLYQSNNHKIINNRIYSNRYGILGENAKSLNITGNEVNSSTWGIVLSTSANSNVSKNSVHDNGDDGIVMSTAPNATVKSNSVWNNHDGIVLSSAPGANVSDNNASYNSNDGIVIASSPKSNITNNTIKKNWRGIYVSSSASVWTDRNIVFNNTWYGIHIYLSDSNNISKNSVNLSRGELDSAAVYLSYSNMSTINDNLIYDNLKGILLWYSPYANISNNRVNLSRGDLESKAIYLSNSSRGRITKNTVYDNYNGIILWDSPNAVLTDNTAILNSNGIMLMKSGSSLINKNYIKQSGDTGIAVVSSDSVDVNNNTAINSGTGISMQSSNSGGINDSTASNNGYGISLGSSNNIKIVNNTAEDNSYGISLSSSSRNNITKNLADRNNFGLYIVWSSNENSVYNNTFNNSPNYGGYLFKSNYNNISNNDLSLSGIGIHLEESNNNTLFLNNATRSTNYGIDLYSSNYNSIIRNNARYSSSIGVGLSSSNRNNISENIAENNSIGTSLRWSGSNDIVNNSMRWDDIGIYMFRSDSNIVTRNNASANKNEGIDISLSNSNDINNNTAIQNGNYGIHAYSSSQNMIKNNTVLSNGVGVYLDWSGNNEITRNRVELNTLNGIALFWLSNNNIARENAVNSNGNISIKISSSDSNTIENNSAKLSNIGIFLDWSKNNFIRRNNASQNSIHGITLEWFSDNNEIMNNTASEGIVGLSLMWSSNNRVENNTLTKNNVSTNIEWSSNNNVLRNNSMSLNNYGVSLAWASNNNTFANNRIDSNARLGLYLRDSNSNTIYNNYIANPENAYDNGINKWNITKTPGTNIIGGSFIGGNYWNDYAGVDTDGDGLGDTLLPYNSDGNISAGGDMHPLVPARYAPQLNVSVSESPDPVLSGGTSLVTVQVTADGMPVSGANVSLSATGGSLSPASGTTNATGYFTSTYTAPAVTATTTYTISAAASKTGYTSGSGSDPITVNPQVVASTVVSISDITLRLNKTGVVPILIKNVTNVASAQIILSYNSSVVHVINVANSSFDTMFSNIDNATGATTIGAIQITSPGLNGNVKLADVTLKAVGNNKDKSSLNLTIITLADPSANPIPATTSNGTCSLIAGICGDVNDDGVVDISDAMWLAKNRIGIPGYPINEANSDVNGDGIIDISDAMWLAKNRIGIPGYPLRCP